jgi:hypothetical protein
MRPRRNIMKKFKNGDGIADAEITKFSVAGYYATNGDDLDDHLAILKTGDQFQLASWDGGIVLSDPFPTEAECHTYMVEVDLGEFEDVNLETMDLTPIK